MTELGGNAARAFVGAVRCVDMYLVSCCQVGHWITWPCLTRSGRKMFSNMTYCYLDSFIKFCTVGEWEIKIIYERNDVGTPVTVLLATAMFTFRFTPLGTPPCPIHLLLILKQQRYNFKTSSPSFRAQSQRLFGRHMCLNISQRFLLGNT